MCMRLIAVIFCVFLLSANFRTGCDDYNYCHKEYSDEFKSGSISSIHLLKRYLTGLSEADILKAKKEGGHTGLESGEPDYSLTFVIVGEHRAVNIKEVIFDCVEAKPSIFHFFEPSAQLEWIKDFQMGPPDVNEKFRKLVFPMPVHNVFSMRLRRPFVERLKAQDKFKITLISTYDKEFVLETDNFIKKYDF
ncbi:hypothetical protein bcCo53_001193 (plasmid) [Borrelia coriaceae]|uniref:Protein BptA n=1 Tax=Borrelia coriaceae ATCC 43381 TaxID=1408429 RepID=W5SWM6_9SPIR|nr:hypothetical protein [Borrelia coriaceae]AHH11098.1 hypothetical protein BCO_0000704 [Borrelia coriaceae ATCC 43381]UPA17024.1 hypothetical protein bcCo53_001193 [Borrelia coriaceae]